MKISQVVSNIIAKVNLATTHIANTGNPHGVTKEQVGLGNVANVAQLANTQTLAHTGDVTSPATALNTGTVTMTLSNSGVTAGTYKSVTVDVKGRVTNGSNPTTLSDYGITDAQALDPNLTAISALSGTAGLLKKTAVNTWALDTNTYVTSSGVTSVTGTDPIVSSGGVTPAISMAAATASVNGYMTSTYASKLNGIAANANNYSHPADDGNLHVPATSTTNNGKVLTAGAAAGSLSWTTPTVGTVTSVTAGNGMTNSGTGTVNPTLNIVSHSGTAGTIGTIDVSADAIGVNLGTTSTTAARGDHTHLYAGSSSAGGAATTALACTGNASTATSAYALNGISYKTLDAVAKAECVLTGGGTITVGSSWYVLWSQRFIAIANGYGSHFSTAGYFDITCPTSGTITGVGGTGNKTATAAGIPLGAWESLYYILPIGSNSASVAANFRVVGYTSALEIPSTWIKICLFNQDANYIEFANGVSLKNNTSLDTAQFDVYDSYQANKLKNARSINGVNFDGTGNINTENVDYLSINDDVKAAVSTPGIVGFVSIGTSHSSQPLANDVNQLNNMMYTNGNSKNKLIKNSTFVYSHILSKTTSSTISTTYSTDTLKLKYKNVLEVSFSHFALAGDRADAYIYMLDKFGRMVASLFYYKSSSTWGIGNYTTISLSFYNPVTGQYLGGQSIDSTGFAGTTYGNGALDALIKLTGTQIQFYPMEKVANAYKYNTLKVFSLSAPGISLFENYPVERVYVSNYNSVTTYASGISSVHVSNTPGLLFGNALSTDCVDIDNTPVVSNSNKLVKALVGQSMYSGNAVMVEDGSIVTWGTNTGASLSSFGRGEPYADGSRLSIGQVMLPQSASSIVDASGFTHGGYILDAAKNLYLNGYNPNGILGYGNTNSKGIFDSVTRYGVVEVFGPKCIAYDHNATRLFTRDSNNKIYVTGYNGTGACGIGSTTNALSFTQVTGLDGYTIVKMWNLGGTYGCTFAWTNTGELLAAGYNGQGQLGTGNTTQQNSFVNVTAAWKLIAGWEPVDIFGGFGYYDTADHAEGTVVMHIRPVGSTTQGKVITCGNNQFGQLGDNTTVNKSTPIELTFSTAVTKFEAHGGGPLTCYAVTATNQLYTWGYNGQGQAGVGNTNSVLLPTLVRSDIEEVFARSNSHTYSYRATVFVKQVYSGKLFSCGENTYGQCGLGNTTAIVSSFTEVPFSINVLGHIIDVTCNGTDAGLYYTFLTSKGRVFGTGYNGRWGLGLEHNNAAVTTLTEIRI